MAAAFSLPLAARFHGGSEPLPCRRSGKKARPLFMASSSPPMAATRLANLEAVRVAAREKFVKEASPPPPGIRHHAVSLARALLLVAAEDEAFVALNREKDAQSLHSELNSPSPAPEKEVDQFVDVETMQLAGKTMAGWMAEFDSISAEVVAELGGTGRPRDEVLSAIAGVVLNKLKKTSPAESTDPGGHYLHTALAGGGGSAAMTAAVFVEVSNRLGIEAAAGAGETFPAWPQTWDPRPDDLVRRLEVVSGRDMVGIALSKLVRLHWSRASKAKAPQPAGWPPRPSWRPAAGLVRPEELGLAVMASERLLVVQPQDWALRRDHGMLLFHSGRFGEAVQELSICMAFAPMEEAQVLEPFVEKLHLLRIESSWKSLTLL